MSQRTPAIAITLVLSALIGMAAPAAADVDQEARAIFDAGVIAYEAGRYENALANFEQAYALSHRPELLYNIGISAEHLRRDDRAVAAYEQYLAELPEGANRGPVEARLAVLRQAIAERAETERRLREAEAAGALATAQGSASAQGTPTAAATSNAEPDSATRSTGDASHGRSAARIVLLSSGGALLASAGASGAWWALAGNELDRCQGVDPSTSVCLNEGTLETRRNAAIGVTIGAGVAGAALLVTGLLVGRGDDRRVACAPTGPGLSCAGRF